MKIPIEKLRPLRAFRWESVCSISNAVPLRMALLSVFGWIASDLLLEIMIEGCNRRIPTPIHNFKYLFIGIL